MEIIDDIPERAWLKAINADLNVLVIKTDLLNLTEEFIEEYKKYFPWHLKDSRRSLLTSEISNLKYEFSYYSRIHNFFGIDQEEELIKSIRKSKKQKVISIWSPKEDSEENKIIPCLMSLFPSIKDEKLNLTAVFRARDLIRRMIPNWAALKEYQIELARKLNIATGNLTDISVSHFIKKEDRIRLNELIEKYNKIYIRK